MRISYLQGNQEYNIRIQLEKGTLSTHHLRIFYCTLQSAFRLVESSTLMPLNIPGLLVPFQLLWNPRIVLPHLVVAGNYLFLNYQI